MTGNNLIAVAARLVGRLRRSKKLLLGDPIAASRCVESGFASLPLLLVILFAGVGIYGFTIGLWHGPRQAIYVAVKLPFVILFTLLANGALNGMLAQLLGVRLSFARTTLALLWTFAVFAIVVASLAPVTLGMTWEAPEPMSPRGEATHRRLLLSHTGIIAFAGVVSTLRLRALLEHYAESTAAARRCLFALLAGNLFAGAQISYLLRPVFGQPGLPVEFLRADPFSGNFYESVWWALTRLF